MFTFTKQYSPNFASSIIKYNLKVWTKKIPSKNVKNKKVINMVFPKNIHCLVKPKIFDTFLKVIFKTLSFPSSIKEKGGGCTLWRSSKCQNGMKGEKLKMQVNIQQIPFSRESKWLLRLGVGVVAVLSSVYYLFDV